MLEEVKRDLTAGVVMSSLAIPSERNAPRPQKEKRKHQRTFAAPASAELSVNQENVSSIPCEVAQAAEGQMNALARLTHRQLDVVRCVRRGYSNVQISGELGVSEQTVKHFLSDIFDRLGVSTRLQLAVYGARWDC